MALGFGISGVTDGLVLALDAANSRSYPGTGTTWYDLMGNFNFTLSNASAWVNNGDASYMNFTTQSSKYLPGGTLTNVDYYSSATICIFSAIKAPDGDWKTLIRGTPADPDHQVMIDQTNGISLGMYDNDAAGFIDTGFDVNTIPNYTTKYNFMAWRLWNQSPYYEFFYNENTDSAVASLTNSNAVWEHGFASIGGYHNGSNSPTTFSQEWGNIGLFLYYNRHLSSEELQKVYNGFRGRYGV